MTTRNKLGLLAAVLSAAAVVAAPRGVSAQAGKSLDKCQKTVSK